MQQSGDGPQPGWPGRIGWRGGYLVDGCFTEYCLDSAMVSLQRRDMVGEVARKGREHAMLFDCRVWFEHGADGACYCCCLCHVAARQRTFDIGEEIEHRLVLSG